MLDGIAEWGRGWFLWYALWAARLVLPLLVGAIIVAVVVGSANWFADTRRKDWVKLGVVWLVGYAALFLVNTLYFGQPLYTPQTGTAQADAERASYRRDHPMQPPPSKAERDARLGKFAACLAGKRAGKTTAPTEQEGFQALADCVVEQ